MKKMKKAILGTELSGNSEKLFYKIKNKKSQFFSNFSKKWSLFFDDLPQNGPQKVEKTPKNRPQGNPLLKSILSPFWPLLRGPKRVKKPTLWRLLGKFDFLHFFSLFSKNKIPKNRWRLPGKKFHQFMSLFCYEVTKSWFDRCPDIRNVRFN